jgi:pilus assembly protein CpaE
MGGRWGVRISIVSDQEAMATQLREALQRQGLDMPAGPAVALDQAATALAAARPDLVVLAVGPQTDRALLSLAEIKARVRAHLLAVGRATEPRLILKVLRSGADEFLDEADLDNELAGALGRWRAAGAGPQWNGKLVAFVGACGGCGTSTVAANVAAVLARNQRKVLLLDLRHEAGDLTPLLDLEPTTTLAHLCQNLNRLDATLFERSLTAHASNVYLLAAPATRADVRLVTAEGVRKALVLGRTAFPFVIADLDTSFREDHVAVLKQADRVVLVLRPDFVALRNARRALDHFKHLGLPADRIRVVANRTGQPQEIAAEEAAEALGVALAYQIPDEPKVINRSVNHGNPAVLAEPRARVARALEALAQGLETEVKAPAAKEATP